MTFKTTLKKLTYISSFCLSVSVHSAENSLKIFNCGQTESKLNFPIQTVQKKIAQTFKSATMNRCLPTENFSIIPQCPQFKTGIGGLDSRFPTAAIFIQYIPESIVTLTETLNAFHLANSLGVANILVSIEVIEKFLSQKKIKSQFDKPWINIIPIHASTGYAKWTRDIFKFIIKDGKPALFHLNYGDESELNLSNNTACEISSQCDVPYLVHSTIEGNKDTLQGLGIDSGGNLGAAPGGFLYLGVIATSGFNDKRDAKISGKLKYPILTQVQNRNTELFRSMGLQFVDLDSSFLYVGHVDELLSILKTQDPAPCDFVILRPSLEKAIEILVNEKSSESKNQNKICSRFPFSKLKNRWLSESESVIISKLNCIDGVSLKSYLRGSGKKIISNNSERKKIEDILNNNAQVIANKIKSETSCQNPKIIEVPTLFEDGQSVLPNQVNLFELSPIEGKPAAIVARTFFEPFDVYLQKSLATVGVATHFVNDLFYSIGSGDVHCGTNEIRICKALEN